MGGSAACPGSSGAAVGARFMCGAVTINRRRITLSSRVCITTRVGFAAPPLKCPVSDVSDFVSDFGVFRKKWTSRSCF